MSTFAKASFNAATYSAWRPTYPPQLFEYIFAYHRRGTGSTTHEARWERAVDLGCGTGQATVQLRPFREVIGIDPSAGMLETARASLAQSSLAAAATKETSTPSFTFLEGSAEDLSKTIPENESVDLLIAAQAAHWFDWSKVWPETHRVLRRGGTAAFWVYAEFRLPRFPSLTSIITAYAQGSDPRTSVGPHFQRPGRTILERYLVDVPEPNAFVLSGKFTPLKRIYFCGDEIPPFIPEGGIFQPTFLRKEMRWRDLLGYLRTWSALHNYHDKYPNDLKANEDIRFLEEDLATGAEPFDDIRGGDISIRFWKDLREGVKNSEPTELVGIEDQLVVEWPVALLLTTKT
ncbi:hypothetical protein NLJ89_g8987 [Agrocybe chaxingu]|uniref:Methyltransferase type 11 domain-containing protein n=1 Tax=Agrocybe chaxingu TaxID=84603 RepID=A0A9W8JWL5_9AGAR|nr:hypothetical protein NLJ89_g8987 [Agrocybe chaxingu]